MPKRTIPKTDSIHELARFWDTHDLTDFDDQLEEVPERIFARRPVIHVTLDATKLKRIEKLARAKGISRDALVRNWVLEHLTRRTKKSSTKRAS